MSLLPLFDLLPTRKNLILSLLHEPYSEDLVNFREPTTKTLRELAQTVAREVAALAPTSNKDDFQASIDVQQFKPEEIVVKLTEDNVITVEGKHEEREDEHGYISRHFVRKYVLPEEYDAEKVQSKLSSDGVLNITAPKKSHGKQAEYREIPIKLTGPVKSLGQKGHNAGHRKVNPKRLNRKVAHIS